MSFSRFMSILGLCATVAGGVVAATMTAPAWVVPALGGLAFVAGHLATSPVTANHIATILAQDAASVTPTITSNATINKIADAVGKTVPVIAAGFDHPEA